MLSPLPSPIDDLAFRRAQEVARRREASKRSCHAFIDLCVKIEDPDTEGIVIPFSLWKEQADVLDMFEKNRLVVVLKARQLGFTWLGLAYCAWNLIFKPGYTVVGLSKGEDEAKELVRRLRFILENAPRWLIRPIEDADPDWKGPCWEAQVLNIKILRSDGAPPGRFIGEAAAKDSGRSFTANLILIDEWAAQSWAHEIWQAAYPTVNRPTGGKVIGISTAKPGTLFHEIWKTSPMNGFARVFLPWWTDPRRTKEWYAATRLAAPATYRAEYPATAEEAFSVGIDRFFPDFTVSDNVFTPDEPIPENWTRIRSLDWGYNAPHCVLWGAVDEDGRIWIYREHYIAGQTASIVANIINRIEMDAGEHIAVTTADNSIWSKLGCKGPSVGEEFVINGVVWGRSDKDRVNGWNQVHLRLAAPGEDQKPLLLISSKCENLIREMVDILQSDANPEDCNTRMDDHACDSLRYLVMTRPLTPKKKQEMPPWYRQAKHSGRTWMSY